MTRRTLATILGLTAALGACAHQGGSPAETPAAPPDTLRGVVRQVGSVPFLMTVIQGRDTAAVEGELEEEIARLAGAEVLVFGERADRGFPGPTVRASGYEILSVDGERPAVGILRRDGGSYHLVRPEEEGGSLELSAVPDGLGRSVGAKVWVVVSESGTAVLRYGVLRPADAGEEEPGSPTG